MRVSGWLGAVCAAALALGRLAREPAWSFWVAVGLAVALGALLVPRRLQGRPLPVAAAVAGLVVLAVMPGLPAGSVPVSLGFGVVTVVGVLAATAPERPQGSPRLGVRLASAGPFALGVLALLLLGAAGWLVRPRWPQAAVALGWEWQGTYAIVLTTLPLLLLLALTLLLYTAVRGGRTP